MINLPLSDVRIFLCATPIKMCYGIDTLMGLAQTVFDQDPLSGHLFLFFNRERNRVKILFWDQDGFCIWYKKLEPEDTQIFGFPEIEQHAYNQQVGVAQTRRMVGISRKPSPRRRIMPGQGRLSVPPRALRQGRSSRLAGSGRS